MYDIYHAIVRVLESGDKAALVTIISTAGSTPREAGAKMLVKSDGSITGTIGGGAVEAQAIMIAADVIKKGKPVGHRFTLIPDEEPGMVCGGDMEIFVEPIAPKPTIYFFGAGHISSVLVKVGKLLDFNAVVIDDRKEFATRERFPEADLVMTEDFEDVFSRIDIDERSYIVIATSEHRNDERVLGRAILTPAKYIGMVASKTKIKTIFNNLIAKGAKNKALEEVHSPIGMDINAETPEEIAVSIMAEIIKVRRSPD